MSTIWVNGQPDANISPLDRGLAYGDGLFATMRVNGGEIQYLESHLARLSQGAMRLGFEWQPSASFTNQLLACAQHQPYSCIKILLSRGVGGRGYMPPTSDVVINEVIAVHSLPSHYKDWQEAGINLQTSDIFLARQPRLAGIKHCNRLEQVLVKSATLTQGYDDWLVLDSQRNMIESSMANLFFDIEGQIIIPLQSYAGVAGMMREQIIYQLLEMDYSVAVDELSVENLHKVRHVFMTNSLLGIVDVNRVDHHCFTKAPYTRLIRQRLKLTL